MIEIPMSCVLALVTHIVMPTFCMPALITLVVMPTFYVRSLVVMFGTTVLVTVIAVTPV
jgi:hypothetical protein